MSDTKLRDQLREIAAANRASGQAEMRIAAARAFESCGDNDAARVVLNLEVDVWLKPEEIARRDAMP
jgi:hypothetical protein